MPLASVKGEDEDRVNLEPSAVAGISAFLGKLWKMVEDPKTDHLISWGKSGNTFVIKNQIDFAKTILPNYYKHNNIASFIRQLNMYGFHKIISTTSGALDSSDNDEIEFTHPCFVRGHPYLLEQIKRKMNNPKENFIKNENTNQFNESIKRVFSDIKNLKGKQEHLGSQLCSVKQENEILWRELSLLRQKHAAQQNVLNKLIRFLVSLAQPSSNHSLVKRRLVPLMLKDAASSSKSKISSYYEGDHVYTVKKREESSPGPTIHEIHPSDMTENLQIVETPVLEESSPVMVEHEIVTSPAPSLTNSDSSITSPEPVPAALLLSSKKGKRCIQTMYVTPGQQLQPHFLISTGRSKNDGSPEYLVPDKTDNPLLELVHETETDDNGDFITIVAGDGAEVGEAVPATLIAGSELESHLSSKISSKKKTTPRRRTKKETIAAQAVPKVAVVKKAERKKKPASSKDGANNVLNSNEFLFDIDLDGCSEPIMAVQLPSNRTSGKPVQEPSEMLTLDTLTENGTSIPITVEDMLNVASADTKSKISDASESNVPAATVPTLTRPAVNEAAQSPLQNTNMVFDVPETSSTFIQSSNSPSSSVDVAKDNPNDIIMKQIDECADNTKNMKIVCPDNSIPPTKTYVDDISLQLDSMQTEIDTLKELIQNEGFTLDSNTFFDMLSPDHLNYGMPQDITSNFHRPEEGKIEGHELISSQTMFDLDDIFAQSDWNQSTTPLNSVDTDYCNLNTPQIEKPSDESQLTYPPPTKKIRIY